MAAGLWWCYTVATSVAAGLCWCYTVAAGRIEWRDKMRIIIAKMKRYIYSVLVLVLACAVSLRAQDQVILKFTGQNQNGDYVALNSVVVENITQHWQEVLYYPDTILNIELTGIGEFVLPDGGVRLFQNVPNPFDGVTDFAFQVPRTLQVQLEIYDLNGKVMTAYQGPLDAGCHRFRAWLSAPQTYLLQARSDGGVVQIKMVNAGSGGQNRMEYIGKGNALTVENLKNDPRGNTTMPFNYGDTLSYTGYAQIANMLFTSAVVKKAQYDSELIPLTFTLPLPTVTTETASNIYSTAAWLNGSVTADSNNPVVERGFLFANNSQMIGAVQHLAGAGTGNFYYAVSNLQIATRYYYRAYAQTAMGTVYGNVLSFDTQAETPVVQTNTVDNVTVSAAFCGGNVTTSGGADVTARGVCWSTSQYPSLNDSHTTDGTGVGLFTSIIYGLSANTTYYVRAYATNSAGTAYGEQRVFTTLPTSTQSPFYCGIDTLWDFDGNYYETVEIGLQCWMKENLRTTHFSDGAPIVNGLTAPTTEPYRYYAPNGNSANVPGYGYIYNQDAVMHGAAFSDTNPSGVQGICPVGWHVPSSAEWEQLINYVRSHDEYWCGGDNTHIAKALASNQCWIWYTSPYNTCFVGYDPASNNTTGFGAQPAGYYEGGNCVHFNQDARILSASSHEGFRITAADYIVGCGFYYSGSVRCLLDNSGIDTSMAVVPVVIIETLGDVVATTASYESFVRSSGGMAVTARGVCWSTSPHPTVSDSHTTDGVGTGRFSSIITGLTPGTTYYVRAYATNNVGTGYGEEHTFTTYPADSCGGITVTDYDGNIYHTIPIGQQCWLRENLRTTHFADGTAIALGIGSSSTIPYRYSPRGQDSEVPTYGYLYNWVAAMHGAPSSVSNPSGVQGVCPSGWHLPSDAEWGQLYNYMISWNEYSCGGDSNQVAKALAATKFWQSSDNECAVGNNPRVNNATGFSALPAGDSSGSFHLKAIFWSTTDTQNPNMRHYAYIDRHDSLFYYFDVPHAEWGIQLHTGLSVRCLRD